jgi:hypothetical protein
LHWGKVFGTSLAAWIFHYPKLAPYLNSVEDIARKALWWIGPLQIPSRVAAAIVPSHRHTYYADCCLIESHLVETIEVFKIYAARVQSSIQYR